MAVSDDKQRKGDYMLKLISVTCVFLFTLPAFSQSASKYQVATITDVKTHQNSASDEVSYDVSVKVGDTIYVVFYTPPSGSNTVKYVAGRELLVLVGNKTIIYNDILGQSQELPILSQRPVATQTK
jgi:hypothetical protein